MFLAVLGPRERHGARATAAANLLAAAGLDVTPPAEEGADLAAAFAASGLAVACLCGSDEDTRARGAPALAALRAAGARLLLLAGSDASLLDLGADLLVHDRCPALRVLGLALEAALAGRR